MLTPAAEKTRIFKQPRRPSRLEIQVILLRQRRRDQDADLDTLRFHLVIPFTTCVKSQDKTTLPG